MTNVATNAVTTVESPPEMTPERWARVQRLFDDALARPAHDRAAYVAAACGDDRFLRDEVLSLVAADTEPTPAVLALSSEALADAISGAGDDVETGDLADGGIDPSSTSGRVIGPYVLLREIGRGGMGTVYLAEREDVGKRVALKLLRQGRATPSAVRRLLAERRVLARLEHPHIAQLLDAGVTGAGVPYFAMEYVDGAPLVAACDARALGVRARVALFAQVCDAVAYAHRNLVVHRDLKPSNVLVTAEGTVKLLDFGIAKLLSAADDADADAEIEADSAPARYDLTSSMWLMTPRYSAPEQRRGGAITTATDVYALGLLLRELLSGERPPAHSPTVAALALELGAPLMAEHDVTAPAADLARVRGTSPDRLRRALAGDLEAIITCATAADPTARYANAEQLAEDVRRHLAELPIRARPRTLRYQAEKLLRRRRVAVSAGAVVVLLLGAVTGELVRQYRDAGRERDRAQLEAATSARVTDFTTGLFVDGDSWHGTGVTTTAGELVARAGQRVDSLDAEPAVQARLLAILGRLNRELGRLDIADRQLARAVAAQRRMPGRDGLDLATSLAEYGLVGRDAGDMVRADTLLRRALAIRRAALGDRAPIVGATLADLGTVARARGQYAVAESLLRQAVAIERPPGAPPRAGLQAMANLGRTLGARARYEEADSVLRQLIALARASYGPRHALIASALFDLSYFASVRGDRVAADTLVDTARQIVADEEGTGTRRYLDLLVGAMETRWARGRLRESDSLATLGLRLSAPLRAAGSPTGAGVLHQVALIRARAGDYADALTLARQSDLLERQRGPVSPTYYDGGATLVEVNVAAGRIAAAESSLRAIAPGVTAPGRDSLSHAWYTLWRAILDDAQGRSAAAEPGLRATLAARRASLPPDDFLVAEAESRLGLCLVHRGRMTEGRALLRSGYAKLLAARGAADPYTRDARARLAEGASVDGERTTR